MSCWRHFFLFLANPTPLLTPSRSVQRPLTERFAARLVDRVGGLGASLGRAYPRQWVDQWLAGGCPCGNNDTDDRDRRKNDDDTGGRKAAGSPPPKTSSKALRRCLASWAALGRTVEASWPAACFCGLVLRGLLPVTSTMAPLLAVPFAAFAATSGFDNHHTYSCAHTGLSTRAPPLSCVCSDV